MTDSVTTHEEWTKRRVAPKGDLCWNCKSGTYLVYDSDATQTPRCGQCGELEQDDPAKVTRSVVEPETKPAVRRAPTKPKGKV